MTSRHVLGGLLALASSACSFAPRYQVPSVPVPPAYKEAAPWVPAEPADAAPRGAWWALFGDPVLDGLEARIESDNPTLAAALARRDQAVAAIGQARSPLFPQVEVGADATRNRTSAGRVGNFAAPNRFSLYTIGGALTYEADLWGRIRNGVGAARADAAASAGDLAATRLALQTSLADAYFRLRGFDAQAALLRQTVTAFERAYSLTDARHEGGIASGLDVSRAQTILADARAQISAVANARAAAEHAIAALIGEPASAFALTPVPGQIAPPSVPLATPATLLQRRPDIAAGERRVAAANARIGVARAAFFPALTLGASAGYQTTGGSILSAPNLYWALGPLGLALPLIDGGRRAAGVRRARAELAEAAATYRATVLDAFREVEDQLAAARELAGQEQAQRAAATAAARTEDLALSRYRDGAADYLNVVTAQTAALDAERNAIAVRTQRLQAAVALIRATGGGLPPDR